MLTISFLMTLIISQVLSIENLNLNSTLWTIPSLFNYTKTFLNVTDNSIPKLNATKYFLIDPHSYITDKQKYVINYRLTELIDKLKINTYIFMINKIKIQNIDDYIKDEFDIKNTSIRPIYLEDYFNDFFKNFTLLFKKYEKVLKTNFTKSLILFISVEDNYTIMEYSEDVKEMSKENKSINYIETIYNYLKVKNYYYAVDIFLTNFIYDHKTRNFLEKILKIISTFGEVLTIILVIVVYLYFDYIKKNKQNPNNANSGDDKKNETDVNDKENKKQELKDEYSKDKEKKNS